MSPALAVTLALGGLAALDAAPLAQTMLHQPLVTATLLGLAWGDPSVALEVGIVLQVLAVSTQPVGARTPEDYAIGGVVGAGLALALAAQAPFSQAREASALLGVFGGLVWATLGVPLVKWQRRRNEALSRWCEAELRAGREGALGAAQWAAVAFAFAVGVAFTAAGLAIGVAALRPAVLHESLRLSRAWALAQPLWLGLGIAHVLVGFIQRRMARAVVFGFGLIGTWLLLMIGAR